MVVDQVLAFGTSMMQNGNAARDLDSLDLGEVSRRWGNSGKFSCSRKEMAMSMHNWGWSKVDGLKDELLFLAGVPV